MTPILITALAVSAPAPKSPPVSPIVGTWEILTVTEDGETQKLTGDYCWTFTPDGRRGSHTVKTAPTSWQKYELDEKVRPNAIGVVHEHGARRSYEWFLFEVDGDTLTLCTRGKGRPKSITADKGSGNQIYKLKRIKPVERNMD